MSDACPEYSLRTTGGVDLKAAQRITAEGSRSATLTSNAVVCSVTNSRAKLQLEGKIDLHDWRWSIQPLHWTSGLAEEVAHLQGELGSVQSMED